jgi:arylsulfatase A-like enzyme
MGRIIDELKRLGLYEQTIIYVTADHGFDEGKRGHSNAPYVFLATNDKMVCRNGRRQDVAPTILARFGVDLTRLAPPLDGIPLTVKKDSRPAPEIGPRRERLEMPSKIEEKQPEKVGAAN